MLNDLNNSCTGGFDLRNIFDNVQKSVYRDHAHVHYDFNKVLAVEIFEKTYPIIKDKFS